MQKIERATGSLRGQNETSYASNPSTKAQYTESALSDTKVAHNDSSVKGNNDTIVLKSTRNTDVVYMDEVNRGDMEASQRMVDETTRENPRIPSLSRLSRISSGCSGSLLRVQTFYSVFQGRGLTLPFSFWLPAEKHAGILDNGHGRP